MNKLILGGILLLLLPLALASEPTSPYENCRVYGNCIPQSSNGTSGGGNTTIINQYFNDTIWTNDSESIFPRAGFNQNINLSNRSLYISGTPAAGGKIVEINIENEGDYGLYITGNTADGIVVNGAVNLTSVFNGYGYSSESYYLVQSTGKSYWGYLSRPLIGLGVGHNSSELIGYLAAQRTFNGIIPYFGILENFTSFESKPTWQSGTANNAVAFKASEITYSGGTIVNNYGLKVEQLVAGTNNYAIWTENNLARLGGNLNVSKNTTSTYYFGNGTFLTGVCHSASDPGCGSSGNPFNQSLNTSDGVRFKNITIQSSGINEVPLTIRSNFNASLTSTSFIKIIDNQSITIFDFAGGGGLTLFAPVNGRTMTFSPANGAFDMAGSALHINRFSTSSNAVIGGSGGGGVSSSLLVGNGVGNVNFGSELGKIVAGVVGNNSRLIVAKGGLGQTRSAYSVLNFSDVEVWNVTTSGAMQASNVTIREMLNIYAITLPSCASTYNGSIARNVTDNKPYYCDGVVWNALY